METEASSSPGAIPSVSRRKFFSFCTGGAVLLARPDLLLPKRPSSVTVFFAVEKELRWDYTEESLFFQMLCNPEAKLLPNVPYAADGKALYSTTPMAINWKEDAELKRLAGW